MKREVRKKYVLMVIVASVIGLAVYTGVHLYIRHLENIEQQREEEELRMKHEELERQLVYGERMFFEHNFRDRSRNTPLMNIQNTMWGLQAVEFNEVVFVHSEEEAEGFGEDVVVLWPTEGSEMLLEHINRWIDPNPEVIGLGQPQEYVGTEIIDLAGLGIELPLTIDFMVDN